MDSDETPPILPSNARIRYSPTLLCRLPPQKTFHCLFHPFQHFSTLCAVIELLMPESEFNQVHPIGLYIQRYPWGRICLSFHCHSLFELLGELFRDNIRSFNNFEGYASEVCDMRTKWGLCNTFNQFVQEYELHGISTSPRNKIEIFAPLSFHHQRVWTCACS